MYSNYPQYPTGGTPGGEKDDKLAKVRDPLLAIVKWVSSLHRAVHEYRDCCMLDAALTPGVREWTLPQVLYLNGNR